MRFQRLTYPRNDLLGSSHFLSQLSSSSAQDLETSFLLSLARIDYLTLSGRFSDAFNVIEDTATSLKEERADIYQRVTILLAKASLFAKAGKPEKGFSVALRAASTSSRARLMPSLWEAVGCIAHILNGMGESRAASRLLDSILPQVSLPTRFDLPCGNFPGLPYSFVRRNRTRRFHTDAHPRLSSPLTSACAPISTLSKRMHIWALRVKKTDPHQRASDSGL
jgi:hypothetical protein